MKNTLIILIGIPGSGKTTASLHIKEKYGGEKVSTDDIKLANNMLSLNEIHEAQHRIISEFAKKGELIISDANSSKQKFRDELVNIVSEYNYKVITILLNVDLNISYSRVIIRDNKLFVPTKKELEGYMSEIEFNKKYYEIDANKDKEIVFTEIDLILEKEMLL